MVDVVDLFIIGLLVCVMIYGWVLSRRMDRLWKALGEIGPALMDFSSAVDRSEKSVEAMKQASDDMVSGRRSFGASAPAADPASRKKNMIDNFFNRSRRGSTA